MSTDTTLYRATIKDGNNATWTEEFKLEDLAVYEGETQMMQMQDMIRTYNKNCSDTEDHRELVMLEQAETMWHTIS